MIFLLLFFLLLTQRNVSQANAGLFILGIESIHFCKQTFTVL